MFAVAGETDQLPFEGNFGQTAQGEAPESEHFFDDAQERFDGLLPEFGDRVITPPPSDGWRLVVPGKAVDKMGKKLTDPPKK